jgi:predicted enzyme related to lactoylglutathione lyase
MTAPNLGSLLVGTSQVDAMKDWYRSCFAPEENDMGAFVFGNTQLFVEEHSEVSGPNGDAHRIILNLDVADCRGLQQHLIGQGVTWIREVEQMPFGLIGTVADPDGNLVQIIEWGATPDEGHG